MSMISDVLTDLRKLDQNPSVMRKFGLVLGLILLLITIGLCYKNPLDTYLTPKIITFSVLTICSFLLAIVAPSLLKPLNTIIVFIAMIIGWFMTRIILGILFFLVFLPMGLVMRMMGRDSMRRKLDSSIDSYWITRPDTPFDPKRCRRLF